MSINGLITCSFCVQCQRFFSDEEINSHMSTNPSHFIEERTLRADILDQELETPSTSLDIYERTSACQIDFSLGTDLNEVNEYLPLTSGNMISIGFYPYEVVSGSLIQLPAAGTYKVSWTVSAEISDPVLGVNRKILSTSVNIDDSVVTGSEVNDYGRSEDGGKISVTGEYFIVCSGLSTVGIYSQNSGSEGGSFTTTAGTLRVELIQK